MRGKKCSGPSASHGWHLVPDGRGGWRALTAIGVAGRNSRRKLKGKKKKKGRRVGKAPCSVSKATLVFNV